MFNINEALTAYNYFCALSMSLIGDTVNSWTERSKIIVNEYEAECVRLEADCKEKLGSPYNISIRILDSEDARYYIHVYVDKEHKFSGDSYGGLVPGFVKFREKIEGIAPVVAVTIPENLIKFDIDVNSFEGADYMYNRLHSFYSLLFSYITTPSSQYHTIELADILSCLYLSRMTMFDIDKWTEYQIKSAKYNATNKPDLSFLVSHEDEDRKKVKQEFRLKSDIEEYKFLCETVKDMREKYTFNTNPQVFYGEKFIEDFAKYLDYCKYRVKYRSYTINEMIGPDPIPV
jgi:hypothetical protein